jgi:hypothetical protein
MKYIADIAVHWPDCQLQPVLEIKRVSETLSEAADQLRANPQLKSSGYPVPVLGLIVLCYVDHKFGILL